MANFTVVRFGSDYLDVNSETKRSQAKSLSPTNSTSVWLVNRPLIRLISVLFAENSPISSEWDERRHAFLLPAFLHNFFADINLDIVKLFVLNIYMCMVRRLE